VATRESDQLTPMMRQYREAKASIPPDAVLLFRLGDFYEEFFEDAEKVSRVLELVLTKRQGVPMCGFPHHALESYLPRLVAAGLKVGIADQMEDPKLAKGIVSRQVTRVVTPGTVMESNVLDSGSNNFLAAIAVEEKERIAMAALDVSTGEFFYTIPGDPERAADELQRLGVRECLIPRRLTESLQPRLAEAAPRVVWTAQEDYEFDVGSCTRELCEHFKVATLDGFGCREHPAAAAAAGAVLRYAVWNLRREAGHIIDLEYRGAERSLELDAATLHHLEILQNRVNGAKAGSLLGVLDRAGTAMGSRKLRSWLSRPLCDHDAIIRRSDAVAAFVGDPLTLAELRETVSGVRDLERITARINVGSATPRDLQALSASLALLPGIRQLLANFDQPLLVGSAAAVRDFGELADRIDRAIAEHPPLQLADGGVIRAGYNAELDELRDAATEGKTWLSKIQQREVEATGIKSLKVKFNSVFGYYIEVSKANLDLVPERYIRKQTLTNAERFITPELKELESRILGAEEKSRALEARLFGELRTFAAGFTGDLRAAADALAEVDALLSLAEVARINNYVRPRIFDDDRLVITAGRHPVLEETLGPGKFVPNDCLLDGDLNRMMLLTGPNMAGKSTYIRQTALLVIMAQIGSFVPAKEAEIGLVDRIFSRIGAADDLARGQSTFMVEMVETANILRRATPRSLVILDEIGRGTSTFDGLSIAWAVAEYLHDEPRCRTQFATHYHELTELAATRRGVNNYNVAVREYGDDIIFLRQIVPGVSDRSYGIQVARLAGLPLPVIERASVILDVLENASGAPREAMASLPRRTVRKKRAARDENDEMIQLKLL